MNSRVVRALESLKEAELRALNQSDMVLCEDMMAEQLREDAENYENFLRPDIIRSLKQDKMH